MIDGQMATRKSLALAKYDRQSKRNMEQYRSGKIDLLEFSRRVIESVNEVLPHMTEDELLKTQRALFETMNSVTEVLAKWGHPAPGNDPKRPN